MSRIPSPLPLSPRGEYAVEPMRGARGRLSSRRVDSSQGGLAARSMVIASLPPVPEDG
jgi:hypothetical protein